MTEERANELVNKLYENNDLTNEEFDEMLRSTKSDELLYKKADTVRRSLYGKDVYIRGLIEISNYCKNNCFYCGIRRGNKNCERYRLTPEQIFECCKEGYSLGFRTFVLQGGEDAWFTDEILCSLISKIRESFPDCAITLSLGEKEKESYKAFYDSGANRYLLRHETADPEHYRKLHPIELSSENRKRCLFDLKEIGYQVGSGFMVGSPYQTTENLISDLRFLQELQPDMIGIGPYINHSETPFADFQNGSFTVTLRLISILRLMFPYALIPATTALGTIHPRGREMGLCAGANVVMPNLSPKDYRKLYDIYENKICTGEEAAQCIQCLKGRVSSVGYNIVTDIGNVKKH
ncbi:MAG: [FeFe] hydrogenase H-cluster radical SAM maturase HydE [Clostridia bacterium]|nr:[FeFe] hydrogenase H-cluster radical SAM maturase HydE [Clostridia bacterium]